MPLDIYKETEADPPERTRRVSFAKGPLTPHTKNNVARRSKTPGSKNSTQKVLAQNTTMENGKENQQSGMTSIRRQLRATMSPVPNNKENDGMMQNKPRAAASTSSVLSSALTPSLRHNTKQVSKTLKTPKSMLKRELAFNDAEESLLISPAAFSLDDDSPAESSRPSQQLRSPFDTLHEVETQREEQVVEANKSAVVDIVKNTGTLAKDDDDEDKPRVQQAVVQDEPHITTGRAQQRALLRQHRAQKPVLTESKKETGMTPYRARGSGVQMDLTSMFTEIASPPAVDEPHSVVQKQVAQSKQSVTSNVPVAHLDNLAESLWLDFGDERKNQVGSTRTLSFIVEAPAGNACLVEVERVPFKKGFDLVIDDADTQDTKTSITNEQKPTTIRFNAGQQVVMKVSWTPIEPGGVREVIHLKLSRGRLCVIVHGKANTVNQDERRSVRKKKIVANKSDVVPVGVERAANTPARPSRLQSTAVFAKASPGSSVTTAKKTVQPRILDENWADKQCEAFANWMNYTFQPSEDKDHEASMLEDAASGIDAGDRAALRTLILHRRMAQVRGRANELFAGEKMQTVQRAILIEVSKRRLKLRVDRDMYADLTLRGQIISLLLSYSTPWLRLGLETVFGEIISPETPSHFSPQKAGLSALTRKAETVPLSRMKLTLKGFIVNRVLSDPATLNKYTNGRCKVPSGNFEKKFKAEMRGLTLRRLLTLIVFLDQAKEANILDRIPMLFTKASKVKSTREVLIRLCRDFLSAEGDIIKHLSRIGITVSYEQKAVDEVDYTVKNLAVDLRDGVRLGRVTEILTCQEPKSILVKLRLPAVSRLQKLHNVGCVLSILRAYGVPSLDDVAPHHIVDGHREMVLKLMWSVLAYCGLRTILNAEAIENEIQSVLRANCSRRPQWKLGLNSTIKDVNDATTDITCMGQEAFYKALLLRWCNAICSCFGRSASDFSDSFADGTVLCLLIHYYHPSHLPLDKILPTTRHLCTDDVELRAQALLRESTNFELAQATISELGGIPKMITTANTDDPPEESSMFLSVAYLCSRLIESSREILACIRIQTCYCRYKRCVELEKKLIAAAIILKIWRQNKCDYFENQRRIFKGPILVIERFFVSVRDQLYEMQRQRLQKEARVSAATLIQAHARRLICKRTVLPLLQRNQAALKIQSQWRCYDAMIELELQFIIRDAAVMIQKMWRGFQQRNLYWNKLESIVLIQAAVRACQARTYFFRCVNATIAIQRIWRGFWAQLQAQLDFMDVVTVQSIVRRKLALAECESRRQRVLVVQRSVRCFLALQTVNQMRMKLRKERRQTSAAVTCQSTIRRYLATQEFKCKLRENSAVTLIQKYWRTAKTRRNYIAMQSLATILQAFFRGASARENLAVQNNSAILIQRSWRCFHCKARYAARINGIVRIQSSIRRWSVRYQLASQREAATLIQSMWRGYLSYRSHQDALYLVTAVQSIYRGLRVRRELQFRTACATVIQATWRRYWAELQYQVDLFDIILVQSAIRQRMAVMECRRRQDALLVLQCFVRMSTARKLITRLRDNDVERKRRHAASIQIQSAVRGYLGVKARQEKQRAVLLGQAAARRHLVLKCVNLHRACAIVIQRIWRGFNAYAEYTLTRSDVIRVQALFRRKVAIICRKKRLRSILCVQNTARRWLAIRCVFSLRRKRVESLLKEAERRETSATSIQAAVRGHTVRHELKRLATHATTIQSGIRAFLARLDYQMQLIDIILVQSAVRRWAARCRYHVHLFAVLQIQRLARMSLAKWEAKRIRHIREQKNREEVAAEMIQKTWRCYTIHVDYMLLILSAMTIQALVRRHQAVVKCKKLQHGIVLLQALARGVFVRNSQRHLQACAIAIQSRARAFMARSSFQHVIAAVVSIQGLSRGFLTRMDLDLQNFAAREIQRVWRGYQRNVDYLLQMIAVITIQSAFRSVLARYELEDLRQQRFMEVIEARYQEKNAVSIQRAFRDYVRFKFAAKSARIIQAAARGFLCRQQIGAMIEGIISFQGVCRGRSIRRRRPKKARIIAKRLAEANLRALENPSMRLGARTASALLVLQNSSRLVEIMNAVTTLETSTRLSRNCCIAFTECEAPEIVYSLVRTCNRSLPHVELLHYVLLTLTNVARHEELLWRVSTEESVEVFMDLVQMFRDKDNVFCLAVSLLYKAIAKNSDLKHICASNENVKRLKGVHSLCMRKLSVTSTNTRVTRSMSESGKRKAKNATVPIDRRQGVNVLQKIVRVLED